MALSILSQIYRRLSWRLVAGAAAIVFFGWLGGVVAKGETLALDSAIREWVHGWASPGLTAACVFLSFIGGPLFLVILAASILAVFVRLKRRREAAVFIITMGGEIVIESSLKLLYGRARPEAFFDYPLPSSFSFPSGHAFGSVCFFGIVAWAVARQFTNRTLRVAIWAAAVFLMITIGLSRVYLGVHWPSDVFAGFVGGWIWLGTVLIHRHRNFRLKTQD